MSGCSAERKAKRASKAGTYEKAPTCWRQSRAKDELLVRSGNRSRPGRCKIRTMGVMPMDREGRG